MRLLFGFILAACLFAAGCNQESVDADVTQADVEKNKQEFSQESYEEAMKKAGKGDELAAEKERNAQYQNAGGDQGK